MKGKERKGQERRKGWKENTWERRRASKR